MTTNNNYGIGITHDFKKEIEDTLRPAMERQTRADMHDEPSHEAVDKEIAYLTVSHRSLFNENCAVYEMHSRISLQQL